MAYQQSIDSYQSTSMRINGRAYAALWGASATSMLAGRAHKSAAPQPAFDEEHILSALEAIYAAMEMAADIMDEGAAEHWADFREQLIAWEIDPEAFAASEDADALEEVAANFQYQFVRLMEGLFDRTEALLAEHKHSAQHLGGYGIEWCYVNRYRTKTGHKIHQPGSPLYRAMLARKAFATHIPLADQVNEQIMKEAERTQMRLQQNLDARRQHEAGVLAYIWRTRDDEQVRSSHAAYDDRIFSWDAPPPDGHPGQAYGCRCHAEPLPPGVPAPPPFDASQVPTDEEIIDDLVDGVIDAGMAVAFTIGVGKAWRTYNAAVRGIQQASRRAAQRLAARRAEKLARQTTERLEEILMPMC